MKNGLSITVVFDAQSANYGESIGNVAALKQVSRNGAAYTYISRQALRYNMVKQLAWDNSPVAGDEAVIQFTPDASIKDYPEIDLFGYMKTSKGKTGGAVTRNAVARLSHAISLESYKGDQDFLNNMGLARRIGKDNNLAQSENHKSLYSYTLTIDLDRVGIDGDVKISESEKAKRVVDLLNVIKLLYRDIKGRRENLNPLFVIGGVYEHKNPYFADKIKLNRNNLNIEALVDARRIDKDAEDNTKVGYASGTFANEADIKEKLQPISIRDFFDALKKEVEAQYGR